MVYCRHTDACGHAATPTCRYADQGGVYAVHHPVKLQMCCCQSAKHSMGLALFHVPGFPQLKRQAEQSYCNAAAFPLCLDIANRRHAQVSRARRAARSMEAPHAQITATCNGRRAAAVCVCSFLTSRCSLCMLYYRYHIKVQSARALCLLRQRAVVHARAASFW